LAIESRAPVRIDLAGGTLDIFPLYLFEGYGLTVNEAINLHTFVSVDPRPDRKFAIQLEHRKKSLAANNTRHLRIRGGLVGGDFDLIARLVDFYQPNTGLDIKIRSTAPQGSGLGSSTAMSVALAGALNRLTGREFTREQIIDTCCNIEAQAMGVPAGKQDHYASVFGGLNAIWFGVDGNKVERMRMSKEKLRELKSRLLLFYTEPRASGYTNWQMFKRYIDGNKASRESMRAIKITAEKMAEALRNEDLEEFGKLLAEEWKNRKKLAKGVTTPKIDKMEAVAKRAGAMAIKVCGAGGGGCVLVFTKAGKEKEVESNLKQAGFKHVPYDIENDGLVVSGVA